MHKGVDFLYEGVVNSLEAKAKTIKVFRSQLASLVTYKIQDDGEGIDKDKDPFEKGFSTKSSKRGLGLTLIKEIDNDAILERVDNLTKLSFSINTYLTEEGNLSNTLALLYSRIGEIADLSFFDNGKEIVTSKILTEVEVFNTTKGIFEIQRLLDEKYLSKEQMMPKLTLEDLRKLRKVEAMRLHSREIHGKTSHIAVCMGTCGIAAGAKEVLNVLVDEANKNKIDNLVITQAGCQDNCKDEPVVQVYTPETGGVAYGKVDAKVAAKIIKEHIMGGKIVKSHQIEMEV